MSLTPDKGGEVEEQTQTSAAHSPAVDIAETQEISKSIKMEVENVQEESATVEHASHPVDAAEAHSKPEFDTTTDKESLILNQEENQEKSTEDDKQTDQTDAEHENTNDLPNTTLTQDESKEINPGDGKPTDQTETEPSTETIDVSAPPLQKEDSELQSPENAVQKTPEKNRASEDEDKKEDEKEILKEDTKLISEQEKGDQSTVSNKTLHNDGADKIDDKNAQTPVPLPSGGANTNQGGMEALEEESHLPNIEQMHTPNTTTLTERQLNTPTHPPPVHSEDTHPINLKWGFGINYNIPAINLSDENRTTIAYAVAHVAVLYDYIGNTQKILQGHGNSLSCMACSHDKRWLTTADKGPGSCVIVWDSITCVPVQTIFDSENGVGFSALAISPDGKYIITISADTSQVVNLWDWTTSSDTPLHQLIINPAHGIQNKVNFHPGNNMKFVSNSESQVLFYTWEFDGLKFDAPFLSDSIFNRPVGLYSESIFQGGKCNRALSATSIGNIVVWIPAYSRKQQENGAQDKYRPLKLLRIKEKGISSLTQIDGMIVSGDVTGHIRFFDEHLNLLFWCQGSNLGPVNGISFSYNRDDSDGLNNHMSADATIKGSDFNVCDFIVSTKSAEVVNVENNGTKTRHLLTEHNGAIHAISTSPTKSWVCVGSHAGLLKLWNYDTKKVIATRLFKNKEKIQALAFNHNGLQIAIGLSSGAVHIVDATSLNDETKFHYAKKSVTLCKFSHDSKYFATADAEYTTSVFIYSLDLGWMYLGRYCAHYEPILDLIFGVDLDINKQRLLTIGKDRVLVEYDLESSNTDDLKLLQYNRIEQSAIPLCMDWYPSITKENFLVVANDEYKMKLLNTTTKMCRKTFLGPTFGSPVKKILVVPGNSTSTHMLAYATENMVGLQLLPLDGNPHRSVALIAHPQGVSQIACSHDGSHIFTCGGTDASVHMWSINIKSMLAVEALGGSSLDPYYGLIEGGKEGEMFSELENYFYYAQLQSQGMVTTEEREVSNKVQLDQVPSLMRALGFYPSEQQIEDITNEVKFSKFVETGEHVEEIDLADFIKLYVNHRPAFGLSHAQIEKAFKSICGENQNEIDLQSLSEILLKKGEHMTENELSEHLLTLAGYNEEGGHKEGKEIDPSKVNILCDILSGPLSCNQFTKDLLGLFLYDK